MRRPHGDDGAYAILYGLLLTVILGTAALVVDLAAMREDRRQSRLASDSAAVAGARALDPINGGNPLQACVDTWGYVSTNMHVPVPAVTNCTALPPAFTSCPSSPLTASATSQGVTVTVTWPVLQNSPLLTDPDVQGDAAVGAQPVDPAVDGEAGDACARLGVTVTQVHEPMLAGLFGATDTRTTVTSVARALAVPGSPRAIAALNVLNETTCRAIVTSGQGSILVEDVGTRPGIIAVESSGAAGCQNNQYVVDPAQNSSGAFVRADGAGDVPGGGLVYSYALNPAPVGNPSIAYDPDVVPPSTLLRPKPTVMSARVGDTPVRDVYETYARLLESKVQTGTPQPYPHHEALYASTPFVTLGGAACTVAPNQRLLVPPGNWYVDCGTLTVRGTLVFAGGTVVTRGGIDVQGCLAVNVPVGTSSPSCPAVVSGDTSPAPSRGAILYLRSGNLAKGAQGSLLMPRTYVQIKAGAVDLGGGSGTVLWTNPAQTDPACDETCQDSRFSKLALWNESTDDQTLGGQSSLTVRGVVFVPEAAFAYSGQPTQNQTQAQLWADTIAVGGQSGLVLAPDPAHAVASPALGVVLIR